MPIRPIQSQSRWNGNRETANPRHRFFSGSEGCDGPWSSRAGAGAGSERRARGRHCRQMPRIWWLCERREAVALADLVLEALDPRLEELDDPAALVADQVIVVLPRAQPLVPVSGLADPHAPDDPRIDEEFEGAVDRGARDLLVLGAQADQELVGLERARAARRARRTAACRSAVSFSPRRSRYLRKIWSSRVFMRLRLSLSCAILHGPGAMSTPRPKVSKPHVAGIHNRAPGRHRSPS